MKKLTVFLILASLVFAPAVFAEETMRAGHEQTGTMTVYQCPMDFYTAEKAGACPLCGMNLEEKQLPMAEAHKALEESKSK